VIYQQWIGRCSLQKNILELCSRNTSVHLDGNRFTNEVEMLPSIAKIKVDDHPTRPLIHIIAEQTVQAMWNQFFWRFQGRNYYFKK